MDIVEFHESIDKRGLDDCWVWTRGKTRMGYGRVRMDRSDKYAHRVSWELENGEIPAGMEICHRCDNPPCCNPRHLFLGTHADNMRDANKKNRIRRDNPPVGRRHPLAKLSDEDVREIRRVYIYRGTGDLAQFNVYGLAKKYGVAHSLIHRIIKGESWPHLR